MLPRYQRTATRERRVARSTPPAYISFFAPVNPRSSRFWPLKSDGLSTSPFDLTSFSAILAADASLQNRRLPSRRAEHAQRRLRACSTPAGQHSSGGQAVSDN